MADGFVQVAEIMRSFPADSTIGDLINKLDSRLPENVKLAYREWEKDKKERPTKG
jgi:hypothetical protein